MDAMETKLFRKLDDDEKNDEFIAVESRTFLQSVWHDFTGNKRAVAGAIILIIVVLMAIFGPMMCKYSYAEQNMSLRNASPSMDHWFGTDRMGRDIFVRILFGARISLAVGCLAAVINLIVGTIYGGIAGYVGGKVDMVMMRIVDIIYSVPAMLYIVLIMLIFGASVISIMLGISITCWIDMARIVRQQVKSLKEQEFTMAAFVLGASPSRILIKHLLINTMGQIIVTVTLMVPQAIFTEAYVIFLVLSIWPSMIIRIVFLITNVQAYIMAGPGGILDEAGTFLVVCIASELTALLNFIYYKKRAMYFVN